MAETREVSLQHELEESKKKVDEYNDRILRMQAEMENLRKRAERDVSNAHQVCDREVCQ